MTLQQQYEQLVLLKQKINTILQMKGIPSIITEISKLEQNTTYKKLIKKDTQIYMWSQFLYIFLKEQAQLVSQGIEANILEGVASLDDLEEKYRLIEFMVFRFEMNMPEEIKMELLDRVIERNVSGIGICRVIQSETLKKQDNILAITDSLRQKGQFIRAISLFQEAEDQFLLDTRLLEAKKKLALELGEVIDEECK